MIWNTFFNCMIFNYIFYMVYMWQPIWSGISPAANVWADFSCSSANCAVNMRGQPDLPWCKFWFARWKTSRRAEVTTNFHPFQVCSFACCSPWFWRALSCCMMVHWGEILWVFRAVVTIISLTDCHSNIMNLLIILLVFCDYNFTFSALNAHQNEKQWYLKYF